MCNNRASDALPPIMRQYLAIRRELPADTLLLLRLGDFYEMFMDDARRAAPLLGLALTHRAGQPICGIPVHAIDCYLAKIIRAGFKAALCEQVEPPPRPGAPARREVTRTIEPGPQDRAWRSARNEQARAERHGYDTETCLANAAECGGL